MGEDYTWPSWLDLLENEARRNGWKLPPPAPAWKRLTIIRHIRAMRSPNRGTAYDQWVFNMIWWGYC